MDKQKIFNGCVIALFFSFVIWQVIKSSNEERVLNKSGVFVIGQRYKLKSGGNRGGISFYKYKYSDVIYYYKIRDAGVNDNLVFFVVLPSHPETCRIVKDVRVPLCYSLKDVPPKGWREIPKRACL